MIGFYVSVIDGSKRALLLGPFGTYDLAHDQVEPLRAMAVRCWPDLHFAGFGVARVENEDGLPDGKLNQALLGIAS